MKIILGLLGSAIVAVLIVAGLPGWACQLGVWVGAALIAYALRPVPRRGGGR